MIVEPSLKKKILAPLLLVLIAALTLVAIEIISSFNADLTTRLRERADRMAALIQFLAGSTQERAELQHIVGAIGREDQVEMIMVVAGEPARVVASTRMAVLGKSPGELADPELREELSMAVTLPPGAFRFDRQGEEFEYFQRLSVAADVSGGQALQRGAVMVALDARPLRQQVLTLAVKSIVGYFLAVLALAVLCWILLERDVLRPVARIANAVTRFGAGNAARISNEAVSSREFGDLTRAWNGLIDQLDHAAEERKCAEAEKSRLLAEADGQRRRLRDLLVSVPGLVWESWGRPDSSQQRMSFISDYVETMLGYSGEEWLATPNFWLTIVHPDDRDRVARDSAAMFQGGTGGTNEFRWVRKDGRVVWASASLVVVRDPDGRPAGVRGVTMDVTARKLAEADLENARKALIVASRQAGMAEVAANVLHNVGNVLNSVNTSISVASEKVAGLKAESLGRLAALVNKHAGSLPAFLAEDAQGARLPRFLTLLAGHFAAEQHSVLRELEALRGNVEHINEIVAMQQSYAGAVGVLETFPLAAVIGDALQMSLAAFESHGIQVTRELDPALPPISADRNKMLMILVNLLQNAEHACDEGRTADKRIAVCAELNGGGARISVTDNGIGIPAENLTRIFVHGFTTRKAGHGFGLHSSALAASEMGGSLRVRSDGPGRGATFFVDLPLGLPKP